MKVIRYINGKKVESAPVSEPVEESPAIVPAPVRTIVRKVSSTPTTSNSRQPSKGCGCGK